MASMFKNIEDFAPYVRIIIATTKFPEGFWRKQYVLIIIPIVFLKHLLITKFTIKWPEDMNRYLTKEIQIIDK